MATTGLASRSGRQIAEAVLGRLINRLEATPDRQNAVIESIPESSLLYDELNELQTVLKKAEAAGAVELIRGRASIQAAFPATARSKQSCRWHGPQIAPSITGATSMLAVSKSRTILSERLPGWIDAYRFI